MAESKRLSGVEVKDAEQGLVRAVFSTLNVVDHDGDVTLPGAFEDGAPVRISAYGHASWGGALPVGRGTIRAGGDEAVLDGRFFLDTTAGRETFATVRGLGDLQEWSYGFDVLPGGSNTGEWEGRDVRFLQPTPDGDPGLLVHEVSPVLLGAGIGTRTLDVKAAKVAIPPHASETTDAEWDAAAAVAAVESERSALRAIHAWVDPEGDPDAKASYKFPHHAEPGGAANTRACSAGMAVLNGGRGGAAIPDADREGVWRHLARHMRDADMEPPELRAVGLSYQHDAERVLCDVHAFALRSRLLAGLRAKDGRVLSAANRGRLTALLASLAEASVALDELLRESEPEQAALLREMARYERLRAAS